MKTKIKMTTVSIPLETLKKAKSLSAREYRGVGAFVANLIGEKYKRVFKKVNKDD